MIRITRNRKQPRRAAAANSRNQPVAAAASDAVHDEEGRDWAQLLPDVLGKIAGDLLSNDVTEYIRLRAVCKPWTSTTADPSLLDPQFFPRNWLLTAGVKLRVDKMPERFVNVVTGSELRIHLPTPKEYTHHGNTEGLLILHHSRTDTVCLLNPLTMAFTDLPAMAAVGHAYAAHDALYGAHDIKAAGIVVDAGQATVTLILKSGTHAAIVWAQPGNVVWRAVDTSCTDGIECELPAIEGGLSLQGRFFVPTRAGDVLALELRPQPRLTLFVARHAGEEAQNSLNDRYYLAPSGKDVGAGMLLLRIWGPGKIYYDAFRVDLGNRSITLYDMDDTDTTVFMPSLTVQSSAFPHVLPNTAYIKGNMELLWLGDHI